MSIPLYPIPYGGYHKDDLTGLILWLVLLGFADYAYKYARLLARHHLNEGY